MPGRAASGTSHTCHRSRRRECVPRAAFQATSLPIVISRALSRAKRQKTATAANALVIDSTNDWREKILSSAGKRNLEEIAGKRDQIPPLWWGNFERKINFPDFQMYGLFISL